MEIGGSHYQSVGLKNNKIWENFQFGLWIFLGGLMVRILARKARNSRFKPRFRSWFFSWNANHLFCKNDQNLRFKPQSRSKFFSWNTNNLFCKNDPVAYYHPLSFHNNEWNMLRKNIYNTEILVYPDDVKLWTNNANELEENLNQLNNIRNRFGLNIDFENTVIQKLAETQI